jgi:phytoene dehydrogenase-like protein
MIDSPESRVLCSGFVFPIVPGGEQHNRLKDEMADRLIDKVDQHAPSFRNAIMDKVAFTPVLFEGMYGITAGDYTRGLLMPGQMFDFRPVVRWSGYRTPLENLYLCGSGCHPGPGVTAVPGYNAGEVLNNWKK